MDKIRFFIFFILVGILSCENKDLSITSKIISEVQEEYAPDKRTAIFDISAENTTPITLTGETNVLNAKSTLITKLEAQGIEYADQVITLPDSSIGSNKHGLINVSVANIRSNPKHSAELVTQALLGTPVKRLKEVDGWTLIQTPDDYIAWTNSGSIEPITDDKYEAWKNGEKVIYLHTYGFSMDTTGTQRVGDLVAGNVLKLIHKNADNWEVAYPDERLAKIAIDEAEKLTGWYEKMILTRESITQEAKKLTGIPYMWGGTSTKGLDCSGFTKTVYFLHGVILPRDASQQVHEGMLVDEHRDFSGLQTGDLLFFGKRDDQQNEKVIHVGLWLGNNEFIHASGDVHISSMDSLEENFDEYNYGRYLRTKRIVGANTPGIKSIIDTYQ